MKKWKTRHIVWFTALCLLLNIGGRVLADRFELPFWLDSVGTALGALSTRGGQKLRGRRRHPKIEDNVTIYAGASILGGDTVIGHDSVIGSNVFITHPIAPGTRVSIKSQELLYKNGHGVITEPDIPTDDANWFYII